MFYLVAASAATTLLGVAAGLVGTASVGTSSLAAVTAGLVGTAPVGTASTTSELVVGTLAVAHLGESGLVPVRKCHLVIGAEHDELLWATHGHSVSGGGGGHAIKRGGGQSGHTSTAVASSTVSHSSS
jgi:hypothetical protein